MKSRLKTAKQNRLTIVVLTMVCVNICVTACNLPSRKNVTVTPATNPTALTIVPNEIARKFANQTEASDVERIHLRVRYRSLDELDIYDKTTIKGFLDALKTATDITSGGGYASDLGDEIDFYLKAKNGQVKDEVLFYFFAGGPVNNLGQEFQNRLNDIDLAEREKLQDQAGEKLLKQRSQKSNTNLGR